MMVAKIFHDGASPSGKAAVFGTAIRRFESFRPKDKRGFMKLAVHKRAITTKGETNKLRREGNIPAILYGGSEPGLPLHLKSDEIKTILRNLQPGLLATTVFELHEGSH